jgi:uncharacterized protein (UPF0548 family)
MSHGPLSLRKLDDADLLNLLKEHSKQDLTYGPVGITDQAHRIHGFSFVQKDIDLGSEPETFERAVHNIQAWNVHRQVGMNVTSQSSTVKENADVVFQLRVFCFYVTIACRVIKVLRDQNSWGLSTERCPTTPTGAKNCLLSIVWPITPSASPYAPIRVQDIPW